MSLDVVRQFIVWCTVINGALLIFSDLVLVFAGDLVFRMHSKWIPMPRETFNALIYGFMGIYKILFITFNLVPCLVLLMMDR